MMQIFKPLSNMLDLKFFENSARNKSPTYLCKHMTFFLVWAFGQCNSTELKVSVSEEILNSLSLKPSISSHSKPRKRHF